MTSDANPAVNPTPRTSRVHLSRVSIGYPARNRARDFIAVKNATFDIGEGELVCVVGPSGCGKSTILGAIAGLVPYRGGRLEVDGRPVTGTGSDRAVVFQRASLLPWLTVEDNVAYGLRSYGVPRREARRRALSMIELVGLTGFIKSYPYQLSGGMQQRANLARALAADPQILLLDEPFASLDAQARETLQLELLRIWETYTKSGLFITHQIEEAVLLGDKVIVSSRGPASTVTTCIPISIPRPRNRDSLLNPKFPQYVEEIWRLLHSEHEPAKDEGRRLTATSG
jgi:NitT/TauT family transport system ATP-binding protein